MKNTSLGAFTLIELLIVITIIAVLASIALPAFTGVKERGDQTKDLSNAKQIALALRQFAIDNNGSYPSKPPAADYAAATGTPSNSNDAFWWLFPNYLQSQFAYVSNLTDTSNPTFPLLTDGFVRTSPGTYTKDKSRTGGVWSGKKAVVVFCDSSGQLMNVNSATGKIPRAAGGTGASLFDNNSTDGSWLSTANIILNSDPPANAQ